MLKCWTWSRQKGSASGVLEDGELVMSRDGGFEELSI